MNALDAWVGAHAESRATAKSSGKKTAKRAAKRSARGPGQPEQKSLWRAMTLPLAMVLLGLACANPDPVSEGDRTPSLAKTVPGARLSIDGIWEQEGEAGRLVQMDRGRLYVQQGFGPGQPHGTVLYQNIKQAGPRTYTCLEPVEGPDEIVWRACVLELSDGTLVAKPAGDPASPTARFRPIAFADDIWFEAQLSARHIISAQEAHHPAPDLVVGPVPALPALPPPAPPERPVLPPRPEQGRHGRYHALVVGAGDYLYLPAVATAVGDADAVSALLEKRYGFTVRDLRNPTSNELARVLARTAETLEAGDNLVVYFAGHGYVSAEFGRCYWLPVDATGDDPSEGIANDDVVSILRETRAGRVLIVADSCFTASQLREVGLEEEEASPRAARPLVRTRVVLTSGGLEPIQDGAGGSHSVFTGALLDALKVSREALDGTQLFGEIQRIVTSGASQSPEYADIRGANHEGGDFLFVPKP